MSWNIWNALQLDINNLQQFKSWLKRNLLILHNSGVHMDKILLNRSHFVFERHSTMHWSLLNSLSRLLSALQMQGEGVPGINSPVQTMLWLSFDLSFPEVFSRC